MTVANGGGVLVWDFDGTLATRPGAWTGALCDVVNCERPELGATPEVIKPHLQRGFRWHTPEIVRPPCSDDAWWDELTPVFTGALCAGVKLDEPEAQRLARRVRAHYTDPAHWRVYDDVVPALTSLRDRGWRHLLLSNHVPELPRLVEALGLSEFFVTMYSSGRIGVEKPHPRAFETVFAEHPDARDGWMIGDSWRADVQGARGVGMRAILVRETHPDASLRCERLTGIAPIIEGA